MNPKTPIDRLPGIGKYYAFKLSKLGIETVEDLIYHFPFRYDDFSKTQEIRQITPGEKISIRGTVWQIKTIRTRTGKFLTNASVSDESGMVQIVWFNQPYLSKNIKAGDQISLSGKVEMEGTRYKMISPQYEVIKDPQSRTVLDQGQSLSTLHTGRLVPVYPETEGVTSKWLRTKISKILPEYLKEEQDFMPQEILKRQNLEDLGTSLSKIHFPQKLEEVEEARKRLSFDELFTIQFLSSLRKKNWQEVKKAPKMQLDRKKIDEFIKNLPFKLTNAQTKASNEILEDLAKQTPQNRLLEGDVGSGKTVVAAIGIYVAYLNGFDVMLAAPTEILAFQHQKTLQSLFERYGIEIGIYTGSRKKKAKITAGTHALLETFKPDGEVGFVIVDEQHRFGVAQRAKMFLNQNSKLTPHLLTMTATPIPRTLALTLYGDLSLSVLDEMPIGRQRIATFVVPNKKRLDAYKFIEKEVLSNRQAFILTPFVEPSETMATVKSATVEFEKLKSIFSSSKGNLHPKGVNVRLGLLHGRLKSKEKEKIINDFKANKINILVSTPVVEVGIDVPNATIMMIESAERFGLAQLHQLRGRVGRGEHKSYCFLFTESQQPQSVQRLKAMERIHVGFELAQIDLKMRGAGEIFGFRQSGFSNLKIADLSDEKLIATTQSEAKKLVEFDPKLKNYPLLATKINNIELDYVQPN